MTSSMTVGKTTAFGFALAFWIMGGIAVGSAAAQSFSFKDPKGVNSVIFLVDSELEPIMGVASGIDGTLAFDPEKPEATRGTITVAAATVHTHNAGMKKKLQSKEWMNVAAHPTIRFTIEKVAAAKPRKDGRKRAHGFVASGTLEMRGKKKRIEAPISFRHLAGQLGKRNRGAEGDLLVVRSRFVVKRSDFGVGPAIPIVGDAVEVRVAICGFHVTSKPAGK